MAEKKASLRPRRRWPRLLLLWAAFLLLIGLIGCVVLYQYLAVYEVTRPEIMMDKLMAEMDQEDFLRYARQNLDFELTEFEDADALYESFLDSVPKGGRLSYTSSKGRTGRSSAVFVVRSGSVNVCTVELVPGEQRYAFGRHDWALGRISSGDITGQLRSVSVRVRALEGRQVRINGVSIPDTYISRSDIPIDDLSALEKRFDHQPHLVEYTVSPLYGEIVLSDEDGRELFPEEDAGTEPLLYNDCPAGENRLSITAPADVTVTVGGAVLGPDDVSVSSLAVLEGLGAYTEGGEYETCVYRFEGLYTQPEVTAEDKAGHALTPVRVGESRYAFYPADVSGDLEPLQSVAESYFSLYLNYTLMPFDGTYYYALLQKTLWSSELYRYIADSQQAMLWAAQTSPTIRTLRYDNFHRVSDFCFTCTVEYDIDMSASTWDKEEQTYRLQNAYELCFIREGSFWYAAAMEAITE